MENNSRGPVIIDAVPQQAVNEYKNRMNLMWGTTACMGANAAAFFYGFFNRSQGIGELALLWEASIALGCASVYLNYIRKEKFLQRMGSANLEATYSAIHSPSSSQPKGRGRLLKLMSPRLRAGISAPSFTKTSSKDK